MSERTVWGLVFFAPVILGVVLLVFFAIYQTIVVANCDPENRHLVGGAKGNAYTVCRD